MLYAELEKIIHQSQFAHVEVIQVEAANHRSRAESTPFVGQKLAVNGP